MLKHRLIWGPVMIAGLVLVLYLDNKLDAVRIAGTPLQSLFLGREYLPAGLLMLALFLVLIAISAAELCAIFRVKQIPADTFTAAVAGMAGCLLVYVIPTRANSQATTAFIATLMVVLFMTALVKYSWVHRRVEGALTVGAITMMSFVYLGILPGFYLAIRRWHSAWVIAAIILITKCCDIGAYFTGRALGRHKLIPWLSPGKTWEGLIGGVLLSALVATLFAWIGNTYEVWVWSKTGDERVYKTIYFPLWAAFLSGGLLGAVGQFGDLTESLFKRDAGIKDSGSSIPGFGGVLDVLDSPVVVAPVAYWLLFLAAKLTQTDVMRMEP